MQTVFIVIIAFSGIFTFAFGMAALMPLLAAREEAQRKMDGRDWTFAGLDLLLVLLDQLPFFSLARAIPALPADIAAMRRKWREEPSIRGCFIAFLISLVVLVVAAFLW
jgi:hypothetical protein